MKKYQKIFFIWMNKYDHSKTIPEDSLDKLFKKCRSLEKVFAGQLLHLSDDMLEPLLQCKKVQQLDISLSEVSSELVSRMFTAWPELRLLDLSLCDGISELNVQKWRQLYPQVSIKFNSERMITQRFF